MQQGSWSIRECPRDEVVALAETLGISETVATVLARRGYGEPAEAEAFLAGALPAHDPRLLGDMEAACAAIQGAVDAGRPICVHGDYDADGICATALAVLILLELGGEVSWHLPSRFEEGYGVGAQTLERLAEEGCGLALTVDCGVTAVEEVARAKELGLEVVVTDHHRPIASGQLPDCPVVGPYRGAYPFGELCGTGVVWKLGQALLEPESPVLERHLDLVALATIADVVPLVDENRGLAIAGLRALARTQKPGLRELMRVARVDPAALDAGSVGFRIAPRLNAAGRLGRPEKALELLLTAERETAARLAGELEELNRDRQAVEGRILREAIDQVESWPEAKQQQRAYVVAGEEWHEGVIGIVASRLVERYHRPVVLIAGADGDWKGSGRSISAFDLHAGLAACADELVRFGGHRAAAGLSISPDRLDAFARRFAAHAESVLPEEDLRPVTVVDTLVHGSELTLELCAELARLGPFGLGNPNVTLLVAGCELAEVATVGDGKHLRFRVRNGAQDAGSAIAFGLGAQLDRFRRETRYDVAFRLEENHWNGTVAPQLVVRRIFDGNPRYADLRQWLAALWREGREAWPDQAAAVFAELELEPTPGEPRRRRHLLESATFRALLDDPSAQTLAEAA
ncbi:MAG: single-stranded-DNA-specific exonuclease RecJ [Actinomycetota bacterium]|nr:single-stranded-DNA-specific exonuclease RecJ [Actinomycetota bacterium]